MSILVETTDGARNRTEEWPTGDAELINALGKLDGGRTTLVTLVVLDAKLFIAGGAAGMYTVTSLANDGTSLALVGNWQATEEVAMIIGGQRILQPIRYVVNVDRAFKVAKYFSGTGRLDEEEAWEKP